MFNRMSNLFNKNSKIVDQNRRNEHTIVTKANMKSPRPTLTNMRSSTTTTSMRSAPKAHSPNNEARPKPTQFGQIQPNVNVRQSNNLKSCFAPTNIKYICAQYVKNRCNMSNGSCLFEHPDIHLNDHIKLLIRRKEFERRTENNRAWIDFKINNVVYSMHEDTYNSSCSPMSNLGSDTFYPKSVNMEIQRNNQNSANPPYYQGQAVNHNHNHRQDRPIQYVDIQPINIVNYDGTPIEYAYTHNYRQPETYSNPSHNQQIYQDYYGNIYTIGH